MLSYVDQTNQRHEIYVAPGRWSQANDLLDDEKWDMLSEFPPWSDQPPLPMRQPNVLSYTDGRNGAEKSVFLPKGTYERATNLFVNEDWAALEQEFAEWSKYRPCHYRLIALHCVQDARVCDLPCSCTPCICQPVHVFAISRCPVLGPSNNVLESQKLSNHF